MKILKQEITLLPFRHMDSQDLQCVLCESQANGEAGEWMSVGSFLIFTFLL